MSIFYNAFHSPIGSHSSFTLGGLGNSGGLGLELERPADQNVYIGVERRSGGTYEALPFFRGAEDEAARYDHAKKKATEDAPLLSAFPRSSIRRDYELGTDTWKAKDLAFTVYSQVVPAPDPLKSSKTEQQLAYCPSVLAELTIDNSTGKRERRAFFGYTGGRTGDSTQYFESGKMKGILKGQETGIVTNDANAVCAQGFGIQQMLSTTEPQNFTFGLGGTGLLFFTVPPKSKKTFRFAVCFFRGGTVTTGLSTSYWYSRLFKDIQAVGSFALKNYAALKKRAVQSNRMISKTKLNAPQKFQSIHAIRSYYGSTQLLNYRGKPLWVVNEGEYRMMNTFDLTVDHLFYEMKMNPWTVRNELDLFVSRYSYSDKLHFPGGANSNPGGISFTHDMGVRNHFSPKGYSSYERSELTGCFSHMTHEQLVNWILCASAYFKKTGDRQWMKRNLKVMAKCLTSMLNRDNPVPSKRNGIMALDSDRTGDGAEITTYDSLDESLGQARNNVYIAVKGWASYVAMTHIFAEFGMDSAARRSDVQAGLASGTIASFLNEDGYIPAVMGEDCDSQIIPAIEGLVFPYFMGMDEALDEKGEYADLIAALRTHFTTIFKKGVCIYPDSGWKLSSSADNSWLSKIYLCQFVARKILGIKSKAAGLDADKAHQNWLLKEENLYWAWSDQMTSGVAKGSKYYPRGVTSILWLEE